MQKENKLDKEKPEDCSCECINEEAETALMTSLSETAYRL
jgi:hypothetical protein